MIFLQIWQKILIYLVYNEEIFLKDDMQRKLEVNINIQTIRNLEILVKLINKRDKNMKIINKHEQNTCKNNKQSRYV